jgi:hypothetical protein
MRGSNKTAKTLLILTNRRNQTTIERILLERLMPDLSRFRYRYARGFRRRELLAALLLLWAALGFGQATVRSIVCRSGNGNFDAEFRTGVRIHVGAARNEFATHSCAAKLTWDNQDLPIATGVAELDVDAFGADLGYGVPVAAFQIKKSDSDCCVDYRIYSLEKPPRLLRTLSGGDFFNASDTDLDGVVEIWTNDAAAVNGLERLTLGELDSAPIVVLRLVGGRLLNVSAEFQSYFDDEIATIRGKVSSRDLEDFKRSDGRLDATPTPESAGSMHHLRTVKIKVLEIVWAYLYSGREQDAWRSLSEMWPEADVDRIRALLIQAQEHGIQGQTEVLPAGYSQRKKKRAQIFDTTSGPRVARDLRPPRPILLELPPPSELQPSASSQVEMLLDLIVDSAGKVRSATTSGKGIDPERIKTAFTWKFIPAFKDGRAVASRGRIAVSPKQ